MLQQRLSYLHNNPVKHGIVFQAEDYVFSSAIDYCGGQGLLGCWKLIGLGNGSLSRIANARQWVMFYTRKGIKQVINHYIVPERV